MNPQTHNSGAGRSRLVEEIEVMLRKEFGWNEVVMSERMWRFIGVNTEELLNYGINPHEWIEILRHLSINDTYMLGAVHGDVYVRPTSPSWYEVSTGTTSSSGVLYFERFMRRIKMPSVELTWRKMRSVKFTTGEKPDAICVKFYVKLRKSEWPWYGKGYEIIKSFNATELLKYVAGLIDTDGIVASEKQPHGYRFEIDITSANIEFLEFLKNMVYERLGITGSIKKSKGDSRLRFRSLQAVQLYEGLRQYLAHPMKRLRAEVYLRYYNKEFTIREFEHFYEPLKYDNDGNDPKRYHAADMLTQAAPQTHTHGDTLSRIPSPVKSLS
ncbi:hypothetical protein B7L70_12250 [Vulcanisaeta sp. EB80]|uniref:LAGLIDADG family homing endonuclease n=1 Tax=Vulcanisaeta sp. EB80 TaxID=1650660 RepID=UPI0009BD9406|nr:LAGLIDADG family homing endonuclease [Vulcanisaeta sp. EB80]PLC61982.1 hypothetical protein B7L70_12250 [Vulcanisaeta sp. EB80]